MKILIRLYCDWGDGDGIEDALAAILPDGVDFSDLQRRATEINHKTHVEKEALKARLTARYGDEAYWIPTSDDPRHTHVARPEFVNGMIAIEKKYGLEPQEFRARGWHQTSAGISDVLRIDYGIEMKAIDHDGASYIQIDVDLLR